MQHLVSYTIHAHTTVVEGQYVLIVELRTAGDAGQQRITYNLGPTMPGPIAGAALLKSGIAPELAFDSEVAAHKCGKIVELFLSQQARRSF